MGHYILNHSDEYAKRLNINGRDAWALKELIKMGVLGCTPISNPAPRWSGYIHNLRRMGIDIETVMERHGGPFPGCHARYVLRSAVYIAEAADVEAA